MTAVSVHRVCTMMAQNTNKQPFEKHFCPLNMLVPARLRVYRDRYLSISLSPKAQGVFFFYFFIFFLHAFFYFSLLFGFIGA